MIHDKLYFLIGLVSLLSAMAGYCYAVFNWVGLLVATALIIASACIGGIVASRDWVKEQ